MQCSVRVLAYSLSMGKGKHPHYIVAAKCELRSEEMSLLDATPLLQ